MKLHTRLEYMEKTGKRLSRGAWERMNRLYDVHSDGTKVLKPMTAKHTRKVMIRDKDKGSKHGRTRYNESSKVGSSL
jgi:hypothetical protein